MPNANYPPGDAQARTGPASTSAAGFPAIYQAIRFAVKHGVARTVRSLRVLNQKDGVACPSCAWPEADDHRSAFEFCENGAKAVAWEATNKVVDPDFFAKYSIDELASRDEQWLGDQGRIAHPMVLRLGERHYLPIAWDDAFAMVARELKALESPDEAMFYTSGRASNEAAFLYQLLARQFGTNNLPDCSNMCHESSGVALKQSIGIGKGTVKLSDFANADSIFVIGQNPGTCHPRMLSELEKAVRNGCRIVSINPLNEVGLTRFKHPQHPIEMLGSGTALACLFLPVRINGDVAVLKGIIKEMLAMDRASNGRVFDHDFIQHKTVGFDALVEDLDRSSWDGIVESSGVSRELIRRAAEIAAGSRRMITCWAMGITQHQNAVANIQMIANFNLLRGQLGREGAGVCPVRGHSNVQGDRTVGVGHDIGKPFLDALAREFKFSPPVASGFDVVAGLDAMYRGRVKALIALGGNMLSAAPDTNLAAKAFQNLRLCVQISTKLNRNHLVTGEQALILPCLGRTERDEQAGGAQFVTCENSMGVVQSSEGVLEPASEDLRSEVSIICGIAQETLGASTTVDWSKLHHNYDRIRDHIERVVPGFEQYNRRVREPGGFYLPNPPRDRQEFPTASGRAHFFAHPTPRHELQPGQLMMMSIRSHDQFNTTIYGQDDRYRGVFGGRHVIFVNADDARELALPEGGLVNVTSHCEGGTRTVHGFKLVFYDIPRQCAAMYYPESNPLVPLNHTAGGSNQPASKSVVITLAPARA